MGLATATKATPQNLQPRRATQVIGGHGSEEHSRGQGTARGHSRAHTGRLLPGQLMAAAHPYQALTPLTRRSCQTASTMERE